MPPAATGGNEFVPAILKGFPMISHLTQNASPNPGIPSDLSALRAAWHSLSRQADTTPVLAEGLARRRSELLADVESWRFPALLDALNGNEAMS